MCKAHTLSTVSLSPDARPGQNEGVKEGRARWPETVGDCIRSFAFFLFQEKKNQKIVLYSWRLRWCPAGARPPTFKVRRACVGARVVCFVIKREGGERKINTRRVFSPRESKEEASCKRSRIRELHVKRSAPLPPLLLSLCCINSVPISSVSRMNAVFFSKNSIRAH